jgi:uncharacterized protein YeaO (DUF488 family)
MAAQTAGSPRISLKRAYEPPAKSDGKRILVDRMWPRGVTKKELRLDRWAKSLAPSAQLRNWFGHDPGKWDEFKQKYFRELNKQPRAIEELATECRHGPVTLVYGAKDTHHNQAVALKQYLEEWRKVRP